jgi:flavin reductase (DIM6/NTAB) family NADH-FMN oxidoreductase RutF
MRLLRDTAIGVRPDFRSIFSAMNDTAKQAVLARFTYGLYALTVKHEGDEHGMPARWVSQASLDPAMVVVAVDSTSRTIELIRDAHHFAISVLDDSQRELAEKLGKLKGIRTKPAPVSGAPVLPDAVGWVECRVVATLPSGSHTLVLGEVIEAGVGGGG